MADDRNCTECKHHVPLKPGSDIRGCDNRDAIKALEQFDVLDKIRAEIEQLHHHPKLDFINTDKVVDMALEIIDKYKAEQESEK